MANLKASKKDILVNKRNYDRNKNFKTSLKSGMKAAYAALGSFNDDTKKVVFGACRLVDKLTTKGIVKKKTGARKKSRLMKALHKASSASAK
tara:strand:+ start:249 stop:524 length:276 start_codon:yes stop_codon:yes gene_type:complete